MLVSILIVSVFLKSFRLLVAVLCTLVLIKVSKKYQYAGGVPLNYFDVCVPIPDVFLLYLILKVTITNQISCVSY